MDEKEIKVGLHESTKDDDKEKWWQPINIHASKLGIQLGSLYASEKRLVVSM